MKYEDSKELKVPKFEDRKIILCKPELKSGLIVASRRLSVQIDLEKVSMNLRNAMYEPDHFPGLICRMDDPKTILLLFASGKLVCTATEKEEVKRSVKKIESIIRKLSF